MSKLCKKPSIFEFTYRGVFINQSNIYVTGKEHDYVNYSQIYKKVRQLIHFIERYLIDNCLIFPIYELPSFDVTWENLKNNT